MEHYDNINLDNPLGRSWSPSRPFVVSLSRPFVVSLSNHKPCKNKSFDKALLSKAEGLRTNGCYAITLKYAQWIIWDKFGGQSWLWFKALPP